MPFGYDKPHSWLREDDDFDRYNKPGSSDWFSLSDDVSFDKPNNRHDTLKVESLLGYGGYMDLEKNGGALGLNSGTLEKPIKAFQERNGLKVDGLLKPGGPTIKKMKELYGGVFGATPAPTPAMVDAHVERTDAGEEGFLHDTAPKLELKPNPRLDRKAPLMEYERWNRDWARGSGDDPKGLAREYESYIRDLDKDHGHDPGLIFARDLTQQVEKYHGNGSDLAKQLVKLLADRPDLQRQYLGGEVPKAPPQGTFKDGTGANAKAWIDQDRVANGIAPKYAKLAAAQNFAQPVSTRAATEETPKSEHDYKNLLEYGPNFGLPEDQALAQQPPHAPDQPNPRPPRPGDGYPTEPDYRPESPPPQHVPGFADEMPHPSQGVGPRRDPVAKPPARGEIPGIPQPETPARDLRGYTRERIQTELDSQPGAREKANLDMESAQETLQAAREAREREQAKLTAKYGADVIGNLIEDRIKGDVDKERDKKSPSGGQSRGPKGRGGIGMVIDIVREGAERLGSASGKAVGGQAEDIGEFKKLLDKEREAADAVTRQRGVFLNIDNTERRLREELARRDRIRPDQ